VIVSPLVDRGKITTNPEWYTPARYIEAARTLMGSIDLDPASCELANRTVKAAKFFDLASDGLKQQWCGNIFLNPPYGGRAPDWISKLRCEIACKRVSQAILLVNCHISCSWFHALWLNPICFVNHRIPFYGNPNNPSAESVFVYFGKNQNDFLDIFSAFGKVVLP